MSDQDQALIPDSLVSQTRKNARISISTFFFISGFGFSTWASRIPAIQQQLHLNEAQLGGVLLALPVGLMMTMPVTGLLLRRFSSRNIMICGAVLFNMTMAFLGFATQTWQLMLILFCFGSSRNLLNLSMNTQSIGVQNLYTKSIIANFHGIWSLAGFAGALIGSFMVSMNIMPGYHFLIVGIVMTALSVYSYPKSLNQPPAVRKAGPLFTLPDRSLVKYGLVCFASMACEGMMYDWSGIYFRKAVMASKEVATIGFAVYMVAMTLGRLTGDRLVNRFGIQRMLSCSGVLIFVGLLMASAFPYPLTAGFGFMMVGFGVSCVIPLIFSMAGRSKTLGSGAGIAAVSTVGYFGFLVVPPLIGFMAQVANLRWSFGLMAIMGLVITWLVFEKNITTRGQGSASVSYSEV